MSAEALQELLENRHTACLEWNEPWPAAGPEGNEVDAHITLRATMHDCINLARGAAKARGRPTAGQDAEFLHDFIAVHWAWVVERNTVAYLVHARFPGGDRTFATLPGYNLAPDETLVSETPLGVIK